MERAEILKRVEEIESKLVVGNADKLYWSEATFLIDQLRAALTPTPGLVRELAWIPRAIIDRILDIRELDPPERSNIEEDALWLYEALAGRTGDGRTDTPTPDSAKPLKEKLVEMQGRFDKYFVARQKGDFMGASIEADRIMGRTLDLFPDVPPTPDIEEPIPASFREAMGRNVECNRRVVGSVGSPTPDIGEMPDWVRNTVDQARTEDHKHAGDMALLWLADRVQHLESQSLPVPEADGEMPDEAWIDDQIVRMRKERLAGAHLNRSMQGWLILSDRIADKQLELDNWKLDHTRLTTRVAELERERDEHKYFHDKYIAHDSEAAAILHGIGLEQDAYGVWWKDRESADCVEDAIKLVAPPPAGGDATMVTHATMCSHINASLLAERAEVIKELARYGLQSSRDDRKVVNQCIKVVERRSRPPHGETGG